SRRATRAFEADPGRASPGEGTAQDRGMKHAGQLEIGGVQSLTARTLRAVDARDLLPHGRQRSRGPRVGRVLVDHDPDVLVASLDFLLRANQSRHVLMASSILG